MDGGLSILQKVQKPLTNGWKLTSQRTTGASLIFNVMLIIAAVITQIPTTKDALLFQLTM